MIAARLTPADYTTSRWSGGETTQLAIRPRGALYADRAFLWRLSSATVELEKSSFTPLPDYDRLIATLEGEIDLVHDGGQKLHLVPYRVHAFDGGIDTVSFGQCRDFNLMLRKGKATGSLAPLAVTKDPQALSLEGPTALIYCARGGCALTLEKERWSLSAGESLLLEEVSPCALTAAGDAMLMVAQIQAL